MASACISTPNNYDRSSKAVQERAVRTVVKLNEACESPVAVVPNTRSELPAARVIPFVGHCVTPVKPNGTVRLPAFIKQALAARGTRTFLGLHQSDSCLVGFSQSWQDRVIGELSRLHLDAVDDVDGAAVKQGGYARRVFGFCEEIWRPFDSLRLSEWALATSGITDTALFVGTGETFEIWSPHDAEASGDATLVALLRSAAKFRVQA